MNDIRRADNKNGRRMICRSKGTRYNRAPAREKPVRKANREPVKNKLFILTLWLLGHMSFAQNEANKYVQLQDSVRENLNTSKIDNIYQQNINNANDSIAQLNAFITSLEDSLPGLKRLNEIEQQRTKLLDSLSSIDLPAELTHTVDSLRSLPSLVQSLRSKIDISRYQSADTLVTRYIDETKKLLTDQQQKIGEKTSSLLPESFYNKVDKLKTKTGTDLDALAKVDKLTSQYELDYQKYLSISNLQEMLAMDMSFLNNLEGTMDQLGTYSGKLDEYMGQLNAYTEKANLDGIADLKMDKFGALPGKFDSKFASDGMPDLNGLHVDEVEQLIANYGSMDAEQLDQRIDQLAGNYEEFNELGNQTSALEALKSDQMGQLEQLKSIEGQQFDQQMALKKGRVLANDVIKNNMGIVEAAMKEADALKKKYAIVTNSNYKEEDAEKPKKHVEMGKRIYFGGDVQLLPGDPFGIDFSGMIGYHLANRTSVGIAASIRYEFKESENYMPDFDTEPVYGGRAFLQYKLVKSFFLQGETEAVNAYNESDKKVWEINYLAGLGRSMKIKNKLNLNITFLYHINNKGSYAHDRPFVIRVGFSLDK